MRLNEKIGQFLEVLDRVQLPGLIMSSPGYGKTTTVELWCKYKDYNITTLVASQYAPDDILGLQSVVDHKLVRLTPAWFDDMIDRAQNGKRNILFIDEISTCDEFLQAPLLNLIFNKSLGLHRLPENTLIIAAGNYSDDLNGVFNMSLPLINRFLILNITDADFSLDELLNYNDLDMNRLDVTLGLSSRIYRVSDTVLTASLQSFKRCDLTNRVIRNQTKTGLIGFASMRSIDYSRKFFIASNELGLLTPYMIKVISDTVGPTDDGGTLFDSINEQIRQANIMDSRKRGVDIIAQLDKGDSVTYDRVLEGLSFDLSQVTESIYSACKRNKHKSPAKFDNFQTQLSKYLG